MYAGMMSFKADIHYSVHLKHSGMRDSLYDVDLVKAINVDDLSAYANEVFIYATGDGYEGGGITYKSSLFKIKILELKGAIALYGAGSTPRLTF